MSEDFGNGVSRTLSAFARQFNAVVFQEGKPPLDSELNLLQQADAERARQLVRSQIHSGFFMDPTRSLDDYVTDPLNSNQFQIGQQKLDSDLVAEELDPVIYANVNGWIIPITGTSEITEGTTTNSVRLFPPPDSDSRTDLVFLEVWQVSVAPNPSTANKPSSSEVWKYGNVEYGQNNLTDDIIDPTIGFETTERVQIQYRIRVVGQGSGSGAGAALDVYPDGLGDPSIFAQGPNTAALSFPFENMRQELGDPSLWRAGDGDSNNTLNTVDGYVYAIPICAIFRRNSQPYVAATFSGSPNQNGAFNRNPSAQTLANPQDGAKKFFIPTLGETLPAEQFAVDTVVAVSNLQGSYLDDANLDLTRLFIVVDQEVIQVSAVDTVQNEITIPAGGRGRWGSDIVSHIGSAVGLLGETTPIFLFNTRPDGRFADEVAEEDILDLRRAVNFGDWDYERVLLHNLNALFRNRLRSTWKQTGAPGGDTEGVTVEEVSYLLADGGTAVPVGTEAVDGPDGIRTNWSDAAVIQGDVTMLLDPNGSMSGGFIQTLDDLVEWDVGADFKPAAFMNNKNNLNPGFTNGSTVFVYIGGDDGTNGARKTFRDGSTRAVRFVTPREYWRARFPDDSTGMQTPVTMLWVSSDQANAGVAGPGAGLQALSPAGPGELESQHPGPMYPLQFTKFEKPFLVCGGTLNSSSEITGIDGATQLISRNVPVFDPSIPLGEGEIVLPGLDFDAAGSWWQKDSNGQFVNDPTAISQPVLRGERTLWSLLTDNGRDITGNSSEVYLILFGDDGSTANNGAFKVIGAGTSTAGLTTNPATASNRVRVKFLTQGVTDFDNTTTKTVTAQLRTQFTNSEDGNGSAGGPASLTVTFTDLGAVTGGGSNPWNEANINPGGVKPGRTLQTPFNEKAVLNLTLLYHPGRGAMARIPDQINRVAIQAPQGKILRQSKAFLDPSFPTLTGAPGNPNEVNYSPAHVQTWNRLPSLGLPAPQAPNYGGNIVLQSEIDRESEIFFDVGSKTLIFRPFQKQSMTLKGITIDPSVNGEVGTLLGVNDPPSLPSASTTYPVPSLIPSGFQGPKDDAQLFTSGLQMGYAVPQQYMPRFGRQDIPYFQDNGPGFGSLEFLEGINHLFCDTTDLTNPVFDIIGGEDNKSGGVKVTPLYVQTGPTSGLKYGQFATITGTTKPGYQGRLTSDIGNACAEAKEISDKFANVISSDFGAGLAGIQLPPYLGIARLYGVYERNDFVAKGGVTYGSDRVTPEANPAVNLLRRDANKQTLFICEDGAFDLTGQRGDHTYVVPFNAIDITKIPGVTPDSNPDPSDFEYVLEFTAFGFSQGFINQNNYVMARRHNGVGTLRTDADNPELQGAIMCIPSAAADGTQMYVGYNRTVYQGDPYHSRQGATRVISDYENRYGQVSQNDAFGLNSSIQQFQDGVQVPERNNVRGYQILASVDFYTTMGTGNLGGRLYPGTVTDVGFVENSVLASSRLPPTVSTPAWRILTRAFTAGQASFNSSRAQAVLEITGNNLTFNFTVSSVTILSPKKSPVTFVAVNGPTVNPFEFDASSPDPAVIARELWSKINNASSGLQDVIRAYNDIDSPQLEIVSVAVGAEGNNIRVQVNDTDNFLLKAPTTGAEGLDVVLTTTNLQGGRDLLVNAGDGTTQLSLSGMTERMPLGILLQDSDFLGENPLNDQASAVQTLSGGIRPVQTLLPLAKSASDEYTRFTGSPGEIIAHSDGSVLQYTAFSSSNPGGAKSFRLYRGGGSAFMLSGRVPGGPLDWMSDSWSPAFSPVLKGGLLAAKALLVRNYVEEAFSTNDVTTDGDEIQMVIITSGVLGNQKISENGLTITGIVSPTGFGEGYAAADRYRINGKPMYTGRTRVLPADPENILMAPFPGRGNV